MHGLADRTAGIVLAAGAGIRFGRQKLLEPIAGQPMLQHVLDLAAELTLAPVVVVLGDDVHLVRAGCRWRNEVIVTNPHPADGISGSVRLGLAQLDDSHAERALMLLGDQPWLQAVQLEALLATPRECALIVPRYRGTPGAPVLLNRAVWPMAAALEGDRGFSQLFAARPDLVTYVDLPGTNPDIDTPADLSVTLPEPDQVGQPRGGDQ